MKATFIPKALEAYDGDSGDLLNGWRLKGVDCPERGEPGYLEAAEFAHQWLRLVGRPRVRVVGVDRYGRLLLDVRSAWSGDRLAKALLKAGHARKWTKEPPK